MVGFIFFPQYWKGTLASFNTLDKWGSIMYSNKSFPSFVTHINPKYEQNHQQYIIAQHT